MLVTTGGAFAQYVSGSFGIGDAFFFADNTFVRVSLVAADINIVSSIGLQISIEEFFEYRIGIGMGVGTAFGVGYAYHTYLITPITIDASFMVLPWANSSDGAVGIKAGWTQWFWDDEEIGVNLHINYYKFIIGPVHIASMQVGIVVRFGDY